MAWRLNEKEGKQRIEQYASWLEREWPSAAASLREGLDEMFTVNRLNLPGSLRRCLATTNLIDSTHSGVRQRTRRVTNWKNGLTNYSRPRNLNQIAVSVSPYNT